MPSIIAKHQNPAKFLAADVNNSGDISTFDLILIRKIILGIDTTFKDVPVWRFYNDDFAFTNPENFREELEQQASKFSFSTENDFSNLKIVGIKAGDVNSSASSQ